MKRFPLLALLSLFLLPLWADDFEGMVTDSLGAPIDRAKVKIQASRTFTFTLADGRFQFSDSVASYPVKVTAGAHGYFNAAVIVNDPSEASGLVLELEAIPLHLDPDAALNDPESCGICHSNQALQWAVSPMAKTGLNKWVFDLYNGEGTPGGSAGFVYQRDSVHRNTSPNSECSACHSPVHWLTDIDNAGMGDIHNPTTDMTNGVQCEVCHRAYDVAADKLNWPGVFPQSFTFLRGPRNLEGGGTSGLEFGLLGDVDYNDFIMRGAYNPQMSAQLCAACHEDNVDVDQDGDFEDPGSVPHETTYSEWEAYVAHVGESEAKSCVDCHMPASPETFFCDFQPINRPYGTIRNHDIRGTTANYLENALTMSVNHDFDLNSLVVNVTLTNDRSGHAVPTGVMIRNMILLVEAADGSEMPLPLLAGDLVDEVGGIGDPQLGYYAGEPGKAFYKNMTDGTHDRIFYTEAVAVAEDTRIMPGEQYQGVFRFLLPNQADLMTGELDVRLIYRRSYRAILDVKGWTETGHGEALADTAAPHYGHLMERATVTLNPCQERDINQSGGVTIDDVELLAESWGQAPLYDFQQGETTSVRHLALVVSCAATPE